MLVKKNGSALKLSGKTLFHALGKRDTNQILPSFFHNEKMVFLEPWRELHCYVLINQGIFKNANLVD